MNENIPNPTLIDPDMKEIVESFLIETKEILEKLDFDLLELEKRPEDSDLLNQIFRSFHTIKGTSGFLGLEKLPHVTHKAEDILNKLRKGEVKLSTHLMDGIILGYDTIKGLLKKIEIDKNEDFNTDEANSTLEHLISEIEGGAVVDETVEIKNLTDGLDQKAKEILAADANFSEPKQNQNDDIQHHLKKSAQTASVQENTIRVDVDRLDDLLDIVSEIVLGRNRLSQVNSKFAIENEGTVFSKDFGEVTKQLDLMTTELQLVVMKLRMIKIGKIFNRYPRLVRDLCRDLGKEVELVIKGEDTEVDKNLIEEINDPLVHLIRNSVDHGVENPEIRKNAGKNPKGTVILSAEHVGNNIVITIEDDGKGIDPNVIRDKAIEKGLVTRERAKEFSRQEMMNLI
ncbi:MAG: chemotaxis protein CheA, partial [Melioribacteraceae bacterium]